jgi:hypothetical protein
VWLTFYILRNQSIASLSLSFSLSLFLSLLPYRRLHLEVYQAHTDSVCKYFVLSSTLINFTVQMHILSPAEILIREELKEELYRTARLKGGQVAHRAYSRMKNRGIGFPSVT